MKVTKVCAACPRKRTVFVLLSSIVLLSLTWNRMKRTEWHSITTLFFNKTQSNIKDAFSNQEKNMLCWESLKGVYLDRYVQFIKNFLETAEKFFMVGYKVNYYVFTDQPSNIPNITLGQDRELFVIETPSYKRWQDITMRRMQIIRDYIQNRFTYEVDYLVCLDVDMKFTDHLGAEILGDVFGVIHPGFYGESRRTFTHERRPQSAGYIPEDEGDFYYTGCFFGGKLEEVYKLTNHCHHAMLADHAKNMEARWHDESYLNRYFLYYKPTKVLSPEYAWNYYYGDPKVVQKKRFINIEKDWAKVRDRRALSLK